MDPISPSFAFDVSEAKTEVANGFVFGLIGFIIFIFGLLGEERKEKSKILEDLDNHFLKMN
jgi:hypothetical protein